MVYPKISLSLKYGSQTIEYLEKAAGRRYAIIKHRWRKSTPPLPAPPDTCPFGDSPSGEKKGTAITILGSWRNHIRAINSLKGYDWCMSVGNMIINAPYTEGQNPKAESIGCGGNFLAFDEETRTHVKAISYKWTDDASILDPIIHNWKARPWMIWKACAITKEGRVINVANALDAYWPMIARTDFWINKNYLEMLPIGPDYRLEGVNVYDGDQPLLTTIAGVRTFHTDWRIETLGVVPPA